MFKRMCKVGLGMAGVIGVYGLYKFAKDLNTDVETCDVTDSQEDSSATAEDAEAKIKRLRVELTGMFRETGDYQFINHLEEAIKEGSTVLVVGLNSYRTSLINWMKEYYEASGQNLNTVDPVLNAKAVKACNEPTVYGAPRVLESDAIDVIFEINSPENLTDIESLPTLSAYLAWCDLFRGIDIVEDYYTRYYIDKAVELGSHVLITGKNSIFKDQFIDQIERYAEDKLGYLLNSRDIEDILPSSGASKRFSLTVAEKDISELEHKFYTSLDYDLILNVCKVEEMTHLQVVTRSFSLDTAIELYNALKLVGYTFEQPVEGINFLVKILQKEAEVIIVGPDSTDRSVLCGILNTAASDISGTKVIDSKCISREDALQKGIIKESCAILSTSGLGKTKRIGYTFCEKDKEN